MKPQLLAKRIAQHFAELGGLNVSVIELTNGVIVLLKGMEDVADRIRDECETLFERAAIGWSKDRTVWCVICPDKRAIDVVYHRLNEELHCDIESEEAREASIYIISEDSPIRKFARSLGVIDAED